MEVIEGGTTYIVRGNYPDGKYVKFPKPEGPRPRAVDFVNLIKNLTATKRKILWALASSNEDINDFLQMVAMNRIGRSNESWVTDGLTALVSEAFITQAQMDNLLGV